MKKHKDKNKWRVGVSEEGEPLLAFLQGKTNSKLSNKALKRLLEKGICKVNSKIERFGSRKLKAEDLIEIEANFETLVVKEGVSSLPILYEDAFFLIANKPPNFICDDLNLHKFFPPNYRLVNRLDKETSGALLIAKNEKSKESVIDLFRKGEVKKYYLAIVDGVVKENKGCIKGKILKGTKEGRLLCKISSKGAFAETHWECLKRGKNFSLLFCKLLTGRSHQLRLHLQEIGHPILGDYHYSRKFIYDKAVPRVMLHSLTISFPHPFLHKQLTVKAPIPKDFLAISQ